MLHWRGNETFPCNNDTLGWEIYECAQTYAGIAHTLNITPRRSCMYSGVTASMKRIVSVCHTKIERNHGDFLGLVNAASAFRESNVNDTSLKGQCVAN
jgi:hypothetical protein